MKVKTSGVEVLGEQVSAMVDPKLAAAKAARLRGAILASISELDVSHIMITMVGRAKNGDHKAAQTVLQLIGAGQVQDQPQPPAVNNTVQVNVDNRSQSAVFDLSGDCLKIARVISSRGPMTAEAISRACEITVNRVKELAGTVWFCDAKWGRVGLCDHGIKALQSSEQSVSA